MGTVLGCLPPIQCEITNYKVQITISDKEALRFALSIGAVWSTTPRKREGARGNGLPRQSHSHWLAMTGVFERRRNQPTGDCRGGRCPPRNDMVDGLWRKTQALLFSDKKPSVSPIHVTCTKSFQKEYGLRDSDRWWMGCCVQEGSRIVTKEKDGKNFHPGADIYSEFSIILG